MKATASEFNPTLSTLNPDVFEVTAKKESSIWKTDQYKDEFFTQHNFNTMSRNQYPAYN